jgi:threonine dehydratase
MTASLLDDTCTSTTTKQPLEGACTSTTKQQPAVAETFDYLRHILTAPIYDLAVETPLTPAPALSARLKCRVLLKREDCQPIFSFKIRGAYNKLRHLSTDECARGVVAVSAGIPSLCWLRLGNHAQGVAIAARHLGIDATIIMPLCTPQIKVDAVRALGANVVLHGDDFDAAKAYCVDYIHTHNTVNIPPFDDPWIIAGQATMGVELLRQVRIIIFSVFFMSCLRAF